jgi:hypothetical protein
LNGTSTNFLPTPEVGGDAGTQEGFFVDDYYKAAFNSQQPGGKGIDFFSDEPFVHVPAPVSTTA